MMHRVGIHVVKPNFHLIRSCFFVFYFFLCIYELQNPHPYAAYGICDSYRHSMNHLEGPPLGYTSSDILRRDVVRRSTLHSFYRTIVVDPEGAREVGVEPFVSAGLGNRPTSSGRCTCAPSVMTTRLSLRSEFWGIRFPRLDNATTTNPVYKGSPSTLKKTAMMTTISALVDGWMVGVQTYHEHTPNTSKRAILWATPSLPCSEVEPMYQYSLEWFIEIFLLAIKTAEKPERNLQRRLTASRLDEKGVDCLSIVF